MNKVKIIGGTVEEVPILYTKKGSTSPWIKDEITTVSSIITLDDCKERADAIHSDVSDTSKKYGRATIIFMKTIKPGDIIPVKIPGCNIDGNYYIQEYTHTLSTDGIALTDCNLEYAQETDTDIFLETQTDIDNLTPGNNPNGMETTLIYLDFKTSTEISSTTNCELSQEKLVLSSGQNTGTMISTAKHATYNWTKCELRGTKGEDTRVSEYYVSNDNGSNYQQVTTFGEENVMATTGNVGRVKVILKSDSNNLLPEQHSIGLLIKE